MDDGRRAQVDELFFAACDLAPADRQAYLDAHVGDDPTIRAEVESLLAHHDPRTIMVERGDTAGQPVLRPERPLRRDRAARRTVSHAVLWSAVAAIVLGALGIWVHLATRATIRSNLSEGIGILIDTNAMALSQWLDRVSLRTEVWADHPETREAIRLLLARRRCRG